MNHKFYSTPIRLARRDLHTLDPQARRVVCESGSLWITQDRDPRDILIDAGETFTPEPGRRVIVYALSAATLRVEHDAPTRAPAPLRSPLVRLAARTLALG